MRFGFKFQRRVLLHSWHAKNLSTDGFLVNDFGLFLGIDGPTTRLSVVREVNSRRVHLGSLASLLEWRLPHDRQAWAFQPQPGSLITITVTAHNCPRPHHRECVLLLVLSTHAATSASKCVLPHAPARCASYFNIFGTFEGLVCIRPSNLGVQCLEEWQ